MEALSLISARVGFMKSILDYKENSDTKSCGMYLKKLRRGCTLWNSSKSCLCPDHPEEGKDGSLFLKMRLWGAPMLAESECVLVGELWLHENTLRGRLELQTYQVSGWSFAIRWISLTLILPSSMDNLSMNSHRTRQNQRRIFITCPDPLHAQLQSSLDGTLMPVQLTPEDTMALVAYLDRDPNLPPFLLSVASKLKSSLTPRASVFSLNTVWYYKSSLGE